LTDFSIYPTIESFSQVCVLAQTLRLLLAINKEIDRRFLACKISISSNTAGLSCVVHVVNIAKVRIRMID
jgi:hypothetical protein